MDSVLPPACAPRWACVSLPRAPLLARLAKKNAFDEPCALRLRFAARLSRSRRLPGRPGRRFRGSKRLVFRAPAPFRRVRSAQRSIGVSHGKNHIETHFGPGARHAANARKSIRGRLESRSATRARPRASSERFRGVSSAFLERPGTLLGRSWLAQGVPGASRERSRRILGAPQDAPGTPPIAQERPGGDFRAFRARFWRVRRASGSPPERFAQRVFRRRWCVCSRYDQSASGQQNVMPSELFRVRPRVTACFLLRLLRSTPLARTPSLYSLHQGKCT